MSHITKAKAKILDLASLIMAAARRGGKFVDNCTSFKWYQQFVGDTAPPVGVNPADFGKCKMKLAFEGCSYEVGIIPQQDGSYDLHYDSWHRGGLEEHLGTGLSKLVEDYTAIVYEKVAHENGYACEWGTNEDGEKQLVMTAY